jgi:hypothetical protein
MKAFMGVKSLVDGPWFGVKWQLSREALDVACHRLVETLGANAIKLRQIGIENDLIVAQVVDKRGELFRHEQGWGPGRQINNHQSEFNNRSSSIVSRLTELAPAAGVRSFS